MILNGKIRPDRSAFFYNHHARNDTDVARTLNESALLVCSWALYWSARSRYRIWFKSWKPPLLFRNSDAFFSEGKKTSQSDYWFRVLIINLFVPLRLLIKPQVDTAGMFHNAEIKANDLMWDVGGQTLKYEEEGKKRKWIKAHRKELINLEHPFPNHDFIYTMKMVLAHEPVTRYSILALKRSL